MDHGDGAVGVGLVAVVGSGTGTGTGTRLFSASDSVCFPPGTTGIGKTMSSSSLSPSSSFWLRANLFFKNINKTPVKAKIPTTTPAKSAMFDEEEFPPNPSVSVSTPGDEVLAGVGSFGPVKKLGALGKDTGGELSFGLVLVGIDILGALGKDTGGRLGRTHATHRMVVTAPGKVLRLF